MMQSKSVKITLAIFSILFLGVIGILSFYIVHNAQWLVGDDAIVINRTGWGIPFSIWDTIKPEIGRFFPLTYMHENLVLLFPGDMHSALQHYILNLILFILLNVSLLYILWMVVEPYKILDLFIIYIATIMCSARLYVTYLNVFSTAYNYFTITSLFILCIILFYKYNRSLYAIIASLLGIYNVFCSEVIFVIPLTLGVITIILGIKQLSKNQIIFNVGLIIIALVFLGIYLFGIYIQSNSDSFYDPSHGTGVTFVENAIKIIFGQKFLLLSAIIWGWRQVDLIRKKDTFHILYDSFLWVAGAILLSGLLLKLDWQLYYYSANIYALPSVVYFGLKYIGRIPTLVVLLSFLALFSYKIPSYVKSNQQRRTSTIQTIECISKKIDSGKNVVWYETHVPDSVSFDVVLRDWQKDCLSSYLRYYRQENLWDYNELNFNTSNVVLYSLYNDTFADKPTWLVNVPHYSFGDILIYEIPDNYKYDFYEHSIQ